MIARRSLLLAALLLAACAPAAKKPDASADRLLTNAVVWAGEGEAAAQAIAIKDGRIAALGADAEAMKGTGTEVVDLGGAFVAPGFIDTHVHAAIGGSALAQVQLRDAATKEEFIRRIGERADAMPGEWILEGSWDHELWGGELPAKEWIDPATGKTPVFVKRLDLHMGIANSAALRLAGIKDDTPNPVGGVIERDAQGRATGLLRDAAMDIVEAAIPAPTEAQIDAALQKVADVAAEAGVTQIHVILKDIAELEGWRRLEAANTLKVRVYGFLPLDQWEVAAKYVADNGKGDDWVRWGGVKGFVDGSLGSTTAWFHQPYSDAPNTSGITMNDPAIVAQQIDAADRAGLHVTVHAIGDRANDWLLDTFEAVAKKNGARDRRFRIEHAQHLTPAAIARFKDLGVIASMQPYHAIDDGRWAAKRIGPERIKTTYAFRSLLDAQARLSFGSDWPVAPIGVVLGLDAAVNRRTIDGANPGGWVPEQKITAAEALRAYTSANAYAGYQEDRLGLIKPGYIADLVVLSDNPLTAPPETLDKLTVKRTVLDGRDVYQQPVG